MAIGRTDRSTEQANLLSSTDPCQRMRGQATRNLTAPVLQGDARVQEKRLESFAALCAATSDEKSHRP